MTKSKQPAPKEQTRKNPQDDSRSGAAQRGKFFEIVNWCKAQPRMKGAHNDWMKLYTSLLDNDGYCGLNDASRVLIVALWLYAADSGRHILPADPEWIKRKIPSLNSTPDLGPLLDAQDCFGEPTPFVRYCPAPRTKKAGKGRSAGPGRTKSRTGTRVATRRRTRRREESRVEETEDRGEKPLRVSEEKNRGEKKRISAEHRAEQTAAETAEEPEKPVNPIESEAGSAKGHIMPKPARSAYRRSQPQSIGTIVNDWLPDHWQDPDAEAFGWEIVKALGLPDDRNNIKARSEWGAFAAWWVKVKKAVPAMVLGELRVKAVSKADYLRTKGRSARNRSAVWFHIMDGELFQRGVILTQQARASPKQRKTKSGKAKCKVM